MPRNARIRRAPTAALNIHLFGEVPLEDLHNLQRRLVYEAASRDDGRITALVCEHPAAITVGRAGSWADIHWTPEELLQHGVEVQFVSRGGGCRVHGPGLLELYVIAPIARLRWSVGKYLERLQAGLHETLQRLQLRVWCGEDYALRGSSGVITMPGIAIRHGMALHGAGVSVAPASGIYRGVLTRHGDSQSAMGSLLSERESASRMANVRTTLIECLPAALGCDRAGIYSGHSLLPGFSFEHQLTSAA